MERERSPRQWHEACHDSQCVEIAREGDRVVMRDSKDPTGPVLTFSRESWGRFIQGAKDGEFDTP